jgi:hypothetical protein
MQCRHLPVRGPSALIIRPQEQWAAAKPMNCEEMLAEQAKATKAIGGKDNHVFVCA